MEFRVETITPEVAAEYLQHNVQNNRNLRRNYVEMLARDIQRGAWRCTHQGIAFDDQGNLIDGQHRLSAVLLANKPVRMVVARGLVTDMVNSIDKGAQRSLHDTIMITHTGCDEKSIALRHRDVLGAISRLVSANVSRVNKISAREAVLIFDEYSDACLSLYRIGRIGFGRKNATEMAACLAALINGVPEDAVGKFLRVFREANIQGCEGYNVQIVLQWRHYLDGLRAKHTYLDKRVMYVTTQFVIWNFVNNTSLQRAVPVDDEKYSVKTRVTELFRRC